MPLTRPIPPEAMPIIEIIRRDVSRPTEPPRIYSRRLRWKTPRGWACLLGLHTECEWPDPRHAGSFKPLVDGPAFYAAIDWFDEQDDPEAATDAVWPQP